MIEKKMIFTLWNGDTIERSLHVPEILQNAPLGAGADNQYYGDIAFQASMMGLIEKSTSTRNYTKIILPMSIKYVEIVFTDTSKEAKA